MVTVRNKFNTIQKTSERLRMTNIKVFNCIEVLTAESIPTKPKAKCKVPWESLELGKQEIMEKNILN